MHVELVGRIVLCDSSSFKSTCRLSHHHRHQSYQCSQIMLFIYVQIKRVPVIFLVKIVGVGWCGYFGRKAANQLFDQTDQTFQVSPRGSVLPKSRLVKFIKMSKLTLPGVVTSLCTIQLIRNQTVLVMLRLSSCRAGRVAGGRIRECLRGRLYSLH